MIYPMKKNSMVYTYLSYINRETKKEFYFLFFLADPFSLYTFMQSVKQSVFRKPN